MRALRRQLEHEHELPPPERFAKGRDMSDGRVSPKTVFRCPRCDHQQETEVEPEWCPVCSFHGFPEGRWIMALPI